MDIKNIADNLTENIAKVVYGKAEKIRLVVTAMLAGGHVLLDDIPGTGKTTLAKALARSMDGNVRRIQFTPDLLPSDITGINFYNQKEGEFVFRPGAIFSNVVIADEINRTTPRTQSALLEAMEERQVSVDGVTYRLDEPFLVIATENPIESQGTFPLPEAQIDRFMMKLSLGYPDFQAEKAILLCDNGHAVTSPLSSLPCVCKKSDIVEAANAVRQIHVGDRVSEYIVRIVTATRENERVRLGVSPRGTLALLHAAQAWAATQGRDYLLCDDVKAVAVPVLSHRIITRSQSAARLSDTAENIVEYILDTTPVPIE